MNNYQLAPLLPFPAAINQLDLRLLHRPFRQMTYDVIPQAAIKRPNTKVSARGEKMKPMIVRNIAAIKMAVEKTAATEKATFSPSERWRLSALAFRAALTCVALV